MNSKILIGAALAAAALVYFMTRASSTSTAPRVAGAPGDRSTLNYGAITATNPVNSQPLLTQLSVKQAIVDLPQLLDSGGALFTPSAGGAAPAYADNAGSDVLGGYYTVGNDQSYA